MILSTKRTTLSTEQATLVQRKGDGSSLHVELTGGEELMGPDELLLHRGRRRTKISNGNVSSNRRRGGLDFVFTSDNGRKQEERGDGEFHGVII